MDIEKMVEVLGQSKLPFVYSGERLNDESCQKALKKIGGEGTVLGVIAGNALIGLEGLAVTDKGIWYTLSNISSGNMGVPVKTKGAWFFDKFIIHEITSVKKTPILPSFEVELLLWDIEKSKSSTIKIKLTEDNLEFKDSMVQDLEDIFKSLISKTGTEYVAVESTQNAGSQPSQAVEKDPHTFDFIYGSIHTIITLNTDTIVIKKLKIDDKTKIQTPKGDPVTISRSAIDSVKIKRTFSIVTLLMCMGGSALIGFALIGGIFVLLIGTILGIIFAIHKTFFIYRKDGTKFKTDISRDENNTKEYDRLINVIFS